MPGGLAVREAVADGGGDWHVEEVRVESSRMVTCKVVGPTRFFLVGVYAPRGGETRIMTFSCARLPGEFRVGLLWWLVI